MRTTAEQLTAVLDHWQSGTGPLYQQLSAAIVSLAEAGSLEHGSRLPSERALAQNLHLSRNTVTAAYQQLRDDGWVEIRPGAAPTLGSRSRGLDGMALQDKFSKILPGQSVPIVSLSSACPPPAPVVTEAFADPAAMLGGAPALGTGYAALGDRDLVAAIVARLRLQGIAAREDEVVVTAGGQQAVWLAVTGIAGPQSPVAMEAVTYPGVFDAVASAGSRPLALPMTERGLDVGAAVKLLRAARPDAMYLTTFHNPTGTAMSEDDALRLLRAAAEVGTTVIDDRITGELALDVPVPAPLATFDSGAAVITISGLSKLFWGGMRIGWLHTNATLAAQLRHRRAAMDLGSPAFLQRLAHRFLVDHYDDTLAWRIASMRESRDVTVAAIREHGLDWEFEMPAGGPCLWVRIPGQSGERFAERADAAGVPVAPGAAFAVVPGGASDRFRLPFYLPPDEMRLGIKILAERAA